MSEHAAPPRLHELEAELMFELWRMHQGTARDVHAALNARSEKQRAYTTVLSVLSRLHTKGLLSRQRRGKADIYRPTITEEAYRKARASSQVEELVDEYGDTALAHFVQAVDQLDDERLAELRALAERPPEL